jgi:plastocyanin
MPRKALPFAFVLALVAAACAAPQHAEVEFGSGTRFVPMVADSLNDAGRHVQVAIDQEGRPLVAYFAFEEETAEGVLPQTRPVGAPSIPGVLMATLNEDGIWTRGAIALQGQITGVDVPFNPAFDPVIADLTAENATGLDLVVDGDRFHAVWGSDAGAYYVTGSTDPSTTEQVQMEQVTDTPPYGVSIGVVGSTPWISYYTNGAVEAASLSGSSWTVQNVADVERCDTCRTAVIESDGGAAIAFADARQGLVIATGGDESWTADQIDAATGEGLAAASTSDGAALTYYDGDEVVVATGAPGGSFDAAPVSDVAEGSAEEDGAGTSVVVDDQGATWVAWVDGTDGVRFASSQGEGFEPIDTGADTATGTMPSVAVTPDGATAYLAWYDTQHEDVLLGVYGEVEGLALAEPSPEPSVELAPPPSEPDEECTQVVDGLVEITANGLEFDTGCIEVDAGEPFTIVFGNEDPDQHNVAIYPSAEEVTDPLFRGEILGGPDTVEYPPVDPLDAGEYYFQCDVHPTMNGTVVVDEGGGDGGDGGGGGGGGAGGGGGGGAGGGGGGQGAALTVTAQNIAFDTDTIELPADTESTITLVNEDTEPHNIAIYTDDTVAENLFRGETVTGDTIDYTVPPIDAGEYYFQCDVHPVMNGTVVVG